MPALSIMLDRKITRTLITIIIATWPLVLPRASALSRLYVPKVKFWIRALCLRTRGSRQQMYETVEEEEKYWESAASYRKCLQRSDARFTSLKSGGENRIPILTSYTPGLLPRYRTRETVDIDVSEYYLSARSFCKWHRMVFPGPIHPTLRQAQKLIKNHSNRDLQEMYRISRMLSDEEVFRGTYLWTPRFRDTWKRWLDTKGPDMAIIFQ